MADQLDNRPVFTIVMGCNGAGKSAWKRANRDRLPERYYDKDSIADGVGGWDTGRAREHTDAIVNQAVAEALAGRHNFGIESTYSGQPGRALVERAVAAGYRVEGVYIGTYSPDINIERIRHRVEHQTGHYVDPQRVPDRHRHSLHNLRQTAARFDELVIVDNSSPAERGIPDPRIELVLERGHVAYTVADPAPWVATWKERFDMSTQSRQRTAAKAARGASRSAGIQTDDVRDRDGEPGSTSKGDPPEGSILPKHTNPLPQRDDEIYCPGDEIWRDRIKADLAAQLEAGGTLYGYRDDGAYVATTKHGDRIISRPPKSAESRRSV